MDDLAIDGPVQRPDLIDAAEVDERRLHVDLKVRRVAGTICEAAGGNRTGPSV